MRFTRTYKFNLVDHLGDRAISLHMKYDPVGGVDLSILHITLLYATILEGTSFPVWRGHQIVVHIPAAHVEGMAFAVKTRDMLIISEEKDPWNNADFLRLVCGYKRVSASMPSR